MEKLQILTTNSNVNMMVVTRVSKKLTILKLMFKVLMKEFLMIVTNVIKVSVTNAISKGMWKLFI